MGTALLLYMWRLNRLFPFLLFRPLSSPLLYTHDKNAFFDMWCLVDVIQTVCVCCAVLCSVYLFLPWAAINGMTNKTAHRADRDAWILLVLFCYILLRSDLYLVNHLLPSSSSSVLSFPPLFCFNYQERFLKLVLWFSSCMQFYLSRITRRHRAELDSYR